MTAYAPSGAAAAGRRRRYRLAVVYEKPDQHHAPLFKRLAEHPRIDLTVYYVHDRSLHGYFDRGFGAWIAWDRPFLDGYHSVILQPGRGRRSRFSGLLSYLRMVGDLRRKEYDAVLVVGYGSAMSLAAYVAAHTSATPVLLQTDSQLISQGPWYVPIIKRIVLPLFFRGVSGYLTVGSANEAYYAHYGAARSRMFSTPFCVDNEFLDARYVELEPRKSALKQNLGFVADLPLVVYSGKLAPHKRPLDLLRAYHAVLQRGVRAGLLFIGDGQLRPELESLVAELRLSMVRITGFVNQSRLPEYYASGDVFVFPSGTEPYGLVANEAMLFGMPIIASTAVGAARDLVRDGVTGYTYRPGDIPALATRLETLLASKEKRDRMGLAARRLVLTRNYDACAVGVVQALDSVGRRGGRPTSGPSPSASQ